jgi:hypothetical protein
MDVLRWLVVGALAVAPLSSYSKSSRSGAEIRAFKRENPCPSTGARRGACAGYVVDHVKPLCAGGADHRSNMQWQTIPDAHAKDRLEAKECRGLKNSLVR